MENNEEKRSYSARKDHSGEEYGDLKILRPDTDSDRGTVYICRCKKCGWEGSLRLDYIKKLYNNREKTYYSKCNCNPSSSIPGDIIGNDIGKLKILRLDPNNKEKYPSKFTYICKCNVCGWEGPVRIDNIKKYGGTDNCFCTKASKLSNPTKPSNTTYDTFGDLIVIGFGEHVSGKHDLWKCRCKCGNVIMVTKANLENRITTRCRQCADKLVAEKNHKNKVYKGEVIHNNDNPNKTVTVTDFDHYDENSRQYYWKWKCNFCGNEGVTAEYGLRNYKFICKKCANAISNSSDKPIQTAIVFNKDRNTNYFEDITKEPPRRSMFFRIISDSNKQ